MNKFVYDLYKNDHIPQNLYYYLRSTDGTAPRIYGLPKIHKPDCPLRPIVAFINSPLYNLSKYVAKLLEPLVNTNGLSLKNSFEFVKKIAMLDIDSNKRMVSFDVVSLFTKIPVNLAKDVILKLLQNDDNLNTRTCLNMTELTIAINLCLDNTYLCFRNRFYKQIFGVAMGSPISVIVANLVMETVENKALKDSAIAPRFWCRYIDDTFLIINNDHVDAFYNWINTIEDSIKFTVEKENNGALPFLDVKVTRDSNKLVTVTYHKLTHTTRYLNFNSAHNLNQKIGLIKTLFFRANSVLNTRQKDKATEMNFICKALKENDYPDWLTKKIKKSMKSKIDYERDINDTAPVMKSTPIGLPFVQGYTEVITRILRKADFFVYHYPHRTIRQILPSTKDPIHHFDRIGAVYQISCLDCNYIYIGETGRCFNTRLKEHKRDLNAKNMGRINEDMLHKKTALVKHSYNLDHRIDFRNCKILDFNIDFIKRRFLEAWFFNKSGPTMNDKHINSFPKLYNNLD